MLRCPAPGAGRIESKIIERRGELLGTSRNEIRRVLSQLNIRRALYVEGRLVTNKPGQAHKPPPDQILGAGSRRYKSAGNKRLIKPHHENAIIRRLIRAHCVTARTIGEQQEQAASHRDVLHEIYHLHLVGEVVVKERSRGQ